MPTVPPTFVSLDNDDVPIAPCPLPDTVDIMSSPTPDPDYDDGILVSVVTGDGMGAITSPHSLVSSVSERRHAALKPRLSLTNLSLHSPSSILGTPFDVSPRFEYPFPPSTDNVDSCSPPRHMVASMVASFSPLSTMQAPLPLARPERTMSPAHPKLQSRDPPVPPSLKKKRKTAEMAKPTHTRKRSHSAAPSGSDCTPSSSAEPWAHTAVKIPSEAVVGYRSKSSSPTRTSTPAHRSTTPLSLEQASQPSGAAGSTLHYSTESLSGPFTVGNASTSFSGDDT